MKTREFSQFVKEKKSRIFSCTEAEIENFLYRLLRKNCKFLQLVSEKVWTFVNRSVEVRNFVNWSLIKHMKKIAIYFNRLLEKIAILDSQLGQSWQISSLEYEKKNNQRVAEKIAKFMNVESFLRTKIISLLTIYDKNNKQTYFTVLDFSPSIR